MWCHGHQVLRTFCRKRVSGGPLRDLVRRDEKDTSFLLSPDSPSPPLAASGQFRNSDTHHSTTAPVVLLMALMSQSPSPPRDSQQHSLTVGSAIQSTTQNSCPAPQQINHFADGRCIIPLRLLAAPPMISFSTTTNIFHRAPTFLV